MELPKWLKNSEAFETRQYHHKPAKESPTFYDYDDLLDTIKVCNEWKVYSFPVDLLEYLYCVDSDVLLLFDEYKRTNENIGIIHCCDDSQLNQVYKVFNIIYQDNYLEHLPSILLSQDCSLILVAALGTLQQFSDKILPIEKIDNNVMRMICRLGDVEKLKIAMNYSLYRDPILFSDAILNFNKECIEFMLENDFEINEQILISSIKRKNINCVKFAYSIINDRNIHVDVIDLCAEMGNEEVIIFFLEMGFNKTEKFNKLMMIHNVFFCDNFSFEDLKYSISLNKIFITDNILKTLNFFPDEQQQMELFIEAVKINSYDMVVYLTDMDMECSNDIMNYCKTLDILKFFNERKFILDQKCFISCLNNSECIRYLLENNCPLPPNVYAYTKYNGDLFNLLIEFNVPIDYSLLISNIYNFEKFKYYREIYNAPWNDNTIQEVIIQKSSICLSYMVNNGCPIRLRFYLYFMLL